MAITFLPDALSNVRGLLRRAHGARKSTVLVDAFLDKAFNAIRDETSSSNRGAKAQIPVANSLLDLVERSHGLTNQRLEISAALVCATQIAHFIGHFEQNINQYAEQGADDLVVGLGLGQLSAAAVSCSSSLLNLIEIGDLAVRLAFRVGKLVGDVSQQDSPPPSSERSWSTLVHATSDRVQEELDTVQKDLLVPESARAYVTAVGQNECIISGEPQRLTQLETYSEFIRKARRQDVPWTGHWHAPHLYRREQVTQILEPFVKALDDLGPSHRTMLSSGTGTVIECQTARSLFELALVDLLGKSMQLDKLQQAIHDLVLEQQPEPVSILTFPTSWDPLRIESATSTESFKLQDFSQWCSLSQAKAKGRHEASNIAIVGMSCRLPGADDTEELWDLLRRGQDTHKEIPKDRFDVKTHYDPAGKKNNASHTPYGCFIDKPGLFDARLFNMSPREAKETDPMHRLALVTAYEALEMSGFVLNATPSTQQDRVGTFYGQTCDDWRDVNGAQNIETYFISGGVRAFAPGRINYYFGFRGPSYSVDTACSSSLAAVQIACQTLRAGECDTAVTGGLNILTAPDIFAGLSKGSFLSKTGPCQTWDELADGYCRADGVGSIILKREEDAIADKDNILGVILASGTNHSADAISITHPHAGNQAYLYESVLHTAGVDPLDVSYVEMHGTGTQAGDTNEIKSVTDVFAPAGSTVRDADKPLYIGAIKSNIGHGEAAAGIAALIKVLLMLRENAIPPHVGIKTKLNPKFPNLGSRNVQIPLSESSWQRPEGKPRLAFVNNFSAAGGNTALLLQDAPQREPTVGLDPRSVLPFVISARSTFSLQKNIRQLVSYLDRAFEASFSSLSYTLTSRRMHHNYRIGVTASDLNTLRASLSAKLNEGDFSPVPSKVPQVAFVFTGQGSFYPSLGRDLFEQSSVFRGEILLLNGIAMTQGFPSFLPAIEGSLDEGSQLSALVTQLALVSIQMALVKLWSSWDVLPTVVIGHSLGEYAALHAANVLSRDDVIHLVGHRATLLQSQCTAGTHSMLAVKASVEEIDRVGMKGAYEIACVNAPNETVIAGEIADIEELTQACQQAGYRCVLLDVPYAFHSSQIEPILSRFEELAKGAVFKKPRIPVICPLLGQVIEDEGVFNPKYLSRHAREPVNFMDAVLAAESAGVLNAKTALIEIGPHPVCTKMVKATVETNGSGIPSLQKGENPWKTLSKSLSILYCAGLNIDWREFHHEYDSNHELLDLPAYGFDNKNYWIDYVNDWCLHKVEPRTVKPALELQPPPVIVSQLSTSSVHRVISEEFNGDTGKVIAQSDLSHPVLRAAVLGHSVNGSGFFPSTIYADIAMTLGNYVYQQLTNDGTEAGLNVGNVEVTKALVVKAQSNESQTLQITITVDLSTRRAQLCYSSINAQGKETVHANGTVTFEDRAVWSSNWASTAYLIHGRIDILKDRLAGGSADSVSRGLAYKMFAALVQYDKKYQGMENVILDGANFEATSLVKFQTEEKDGTFFCSPFWIDSLAHLSGFIVNGSGAVDSGQFVYISHGWESLRLSQKLDRNTEYRSYVKMQPAPNNVMSGDVYILQGEEIIGVVGGVKFQRIPRAVLNVMVPPEQATKSKPHPAIKTLETSLSPPAARPLQDVASSRQAGKPRPTPKVLPKRQAKSTPLGTQAARNIATLTLDIVSQETQLPLSELQDECTFADLGVDSLMSLAISGRLREELDIDVSSSIFVDCETVGELRVKLGEYSPTPGDSSASATSSSSVSEDEDEGDARSESSLSSVSEDQSVPVSKPVAVSRPAPNEATMTMALIGDTIAEQMDLDLEEVKATDDLSSLGMDSLMNIMILGILREKTGLDLPSDLFVDHPSLEAVQDFLGLTKQSGKPAKPAKQPSATKSRRNDNNKIDVLPNSPYHAVSILMQGKPKTATKILFLFPDGSGSATSYAHIPAVDPQVAVYGLNSPFMTNPSAFTNGIPGIAAQYVSEVRRRQPHGPYLLGGWSAGGVIAYEAVQQLLSAGERVEKLILFDSPCPINLQPLPHHLHHFFAKIGLLGGGGEGESQDPPAWLLGHFESSIKALAEYEPEPITDRRLAPKTLAIWARHGVCRYPDDPRPKQSKDDPASMKWLLENRTDFGWNGWDRLLGKEAMETASVEGNHFGMMKEVRQLRELSEFIREFLVSQ